MSEWLIGLSDWKKTQRFRPLAGADSPQGYGVDIGWPAATREGEKQP